MARHKHKSRRRRPEYLIRARASRKQKTSFLIVCEGKTEASYFDKFEIPSAEIKTVPTGRSTVSIIKKTIELRQQNEYDQVWAVFDKDDNKDLNNALQMAKANDIKVAYSNQAFEYWILLHFEDHQGGALHRNLHARKINHYLQDFGLKYEVRNKSKNQDRAKNISQKLFDILQHDSRQKIAIKRAKRLNTKIHHNKLPAETESNTTIYLLVVELLKL